MKTFSDEIEALAKSLERYRQLYYEGRPEVSDQRYDELEDQLKKLAPTHPLLAEVGQPSLAQEGKKAQHQVPMLSLAKTYELGELKDWANGQELVGAHKLDGVSLSLIYKNGRLMLGKTRGNGKFGEIVTEKVKWANGCVLQLKDSGPDVQEVEIRGEICCSNEKFVELAEEMERLQLDRPSSPRNIVAGVLSRKQHPNLARFFDFYAFDLLGVSALSSLSTECEKFALLQDLGFKNPSYHLVSSESELETFVQETKQAMSTGPVGIDGAVFTLNQLSEHQKLGSTAHHPRFKMSYKWPGKTAVTEIKSIVWNTSRLGVVTPVAIIEPVELSDAHITNVTLHNLAMVKAFDLKPGDQIEVIRSGEVIPKFLRVIHGGQGESEYPSSCPACDYDLVDDKVRLICENTQACPAQKLGGILNWIRAVEIEDLSEKRLGVLIQLGLVGSAADLYRLTYEQILSLPLTKEKMARKLYDNIQSSREVPLSQFLVGLGIKGVGRQSWELLIKHFGGLRELKMAGVDDVVAIKGFAAVMAAQVVTGLEDKEKEIDELISVGVQPFLQKRSAESGYSGKTFVITGSFTRSRKEMVEQLEKRGAKVAASVSSRTSVLVIADLDSKSKKAVDARQLQIPLWDETMFWSEFGD